MMEKKSKISVNLSSVKNITVKNVFFKWAFQAGRAIVVLIELVALGALGYRFIVDSQIVDLHDQIERQANLVEFQSEDEQTYRGIHTRLENITLIDEETNSKIQILNDILSRIRSSEFTGADFSVNQNSVTLSGNALSVFTLENFVAQMQEYPQVNSITIEEISTSESGIRFSLRITLVESELEI